MLLRSVATLILLAGITVIPDESNVRTGLPITRGPVRASDITGDSELATHDPLVIQPVPATLTGKWVLTWDDKVDTELDDNVHTCRLSLHNINQQLTGEFIGPVTGRIRDAVIEGRIHEHSSGSLLEFKQHEADYVCSYQIAWTNGAHLTQAIGVWHDTQGRSGNFNLQHEQ